MTRRRSEPSDQDEHYLRLAERLERLAYLLRNHNNHVVDLLEAAQFIRDNISGVAEPADPTPRQ